LAAADTETSEKGKAKNSCLKDAKNVKNLRHENNNFKNYQKGFLNYCGSKFFSESSVTSVAEQGLRQ
jgi:polysaccharide deacetylase 2 family uncharacterized protein YibQ